MYTTDLQRITFILAKYEKDLMTNGWDIAERM